MRSLVTRSSSWGSVGSQTQHEMYSSHTGQRSSLSDMMSPCKWLPLNVVELSRLVSFHRFGRVIAVCPDDPPVIHAADDRHGLLGEHVLGRHGPGFGVHLGR